MLRIRNNALLIGGLDPSAGAGLLADIKTCMMQGVYAVGISSANTVQHESKFAAIKWENIEWMKEQVLLLKERYSWDVVKIGLIQDANALHEMVDLLKTINADVKIIWDPIVSASAGFDFNNWKIEELGFILNNIELIMPNREEAEKIFHRKDETVRPLSCNMLVKSYRKEDKEVFDLLTLKENNEEIEFSHPELDKTFMKHGSGCFYSTTIAALLTRGYTLVEAVEEAGKLTHRFLLSSDSRTGYHFTVTQKLIES